MRCPAAGRGGTGFSPGGARLRGAVISPSPLSSKIIWHLPPWACRLLLPRRPAITQAYDRGADVLVYGAETTPTPANTPGHTPVHSAYRMLKLGAGMAKVSWGLFAPVE